MYIYIYNKANYRARLYLKKEGREEEGREINSKEKKDQREKRGKERQEKGSLGGWGERHSGFEVTTSKFKSWFFHFLFA